MFSNGSFIWHVCMAHTRPICPVCNTFLQIFVSVFVCVYDHEPFTRCIFFFFSWIHICLSHIDDFPVGFFYCSFTMKKQEKLFMKFSWIESLHKVEIIRLGKGLLLLFLNVFLFHCSPHFGHDLLKANESE